MATQHIDTATTAGTGFIRFVDLTKPGVLWGLAVAGGISYHYFRVTLDGQQLVDEYLSGIYGGPAHGNNGLTVGLYFDRELLVEIRNSAASPQTVFWASYATWGGPGPPAARGEAHAEGMSYVYEYGEGRTVLVGPAQWSRIELDTDTWLPNEALAGMLELRSRDDAVPFEAEVPLMLRLAGRTRSLGTAATLFDVEGSKRFEISPDTIGEVLERLQFAGRAGGGLELVAKLPRYANHPATLF